MEALKAKLGVARPSLAALRPDLPAGVAAALDQALQVAPENRHATPGLLVRALGEALAAVTVEPLERDTLDRLLNRCLAHSQAKAPEVSIQTAYRAGGRFWLRLAVASHSPPPGDYMVLDGALFDWRLYLLIWTEASGSLDPSYRVARLDRGPRLELPTGERLRDIVSRFLRPGRQAGPGPVECARLEDFLQPGPERGIGEFSVPDPRYLDEWCRRRNVMSSVSLETRWLQPGDVLRIDILNPLVGDPTIRPQQQDFLGLRVLTPDGTRTRIVVLAARCYDQYEYVLVRPDRMGTPSIVPMRMSAASLLALDDAEFELARRIFAVHLDPAGEHPRPLPCLDPQDLERLNGYLLRSSRC
jgi:hypothetical protein